MTEPRAIPGHTRIAPKALNGTATGVAATVLGVSPHEVRANVTDDAGKLAIAVSAPVIVRSLRRPSSIPETLIERAERYRGEIAARVATQLSREVGRVELELTGALIRPEKRVR